MSETIKETGIAKPSHRDTRKAIEQQFESLLTDWKEQLGEKKFKSRIRKAAKLFSKGLPSAKKDAPAIKKTAERPTRSKKTKAVKKSAAKKAAATTTK